MDGLMDGEGGWVGGCVTTYRDMDDGNAKPRKHAAEKFEVLSVPCTITQGALHQHVASFP